jgi:diguanylate cyclase (GGDEF)-like protein
MKDQASSAAADWSQDSAVEQSPLFQDIDRYLINLWLSSCTEHSFEAGQVVIEAGTRTNEIFLLLSGELRVHVEADGAESLRTLEPGEIAGEVSILTGSTTSAWVTATQPSRALGISREELTQWVQQSHQFSLNLLQIANHRLHSSNLHARHQHREKRKLQAIAMTDGLTGLLNRHWLSLNAQRFQGVSVLALDLDHFKSINDRFGHGAGDQVLQAVAEQLRQGTRPHDAVMRLGGEEFVIVVDMSRSDGDPLQLAERLRVAIEELHIPLCGDEGADQLRVTISIGVATQARQESWEQLLERADQALYSAKNKGRNQVQLA